MDVHVDLEGDGDLAQRIYRQLREAILDGRLRRGDRIPPTRDLARRLEVSRNTVSLAYEWLAADGLLSGRGGAGTFIEGDAARRLPRPRPSRPLSHRRVWDSISPPVLREGAPPYDFGVGSPDSTLFPRDVWRRLLARQFRSSMVSGDYGDPAGHPRLRAAIARHVAVSRGVSAGADEVLVTNGAQHAFDLVARVLVQPGMRVAVENPGYPPARLLFESLGARVASVPVDAHGLDVAALPGDARLVYVTPSHQFPLGMPMSHARRVALLEWAERRDAVVLEDDYDSEFRFGGRPLPSLQALDRAERVVYVGSFSKSLLPALRLGFLVAPPSLTVPLRAASYVAGWHVQWPTQAALASFMDAALFARHLRRARRAYAERHERILGTLQRDFERWLVPVPSVAGMHLAATLRSASVEMERDLAQRAVAAGVGFDRLSAYCSSGRSQPGVVLGYGAIASSKIDEGLSRLRRCLAATYSGRRVGSAIDAESLQDVEARSHRESG